MLILYSYSETVHRKIELGVEYLVRARILLQILWMYYEYDIV